VLIQQPFGQIGRLCNKTRIPGLCEDEDVLDFEHQPDATKAFGKLADAKGHVGQLFLCEQSRLHVVKAGVDCCLFVGRLLIVQAFVALFLHVDVLIVFF
jgi:hypothetical protein